MVRHQGGGHKRRYRVIDFKRNKVGIPAKVASIEYDPNRSARIALLVYADGEKRYIIAPNELKVGMTLMNGPDALPEPGNALPLAQRPGRHVRARDRDEARKRSAAGSIGGHLCPAHRSRG